MDSKKDKKGRGAASSDQKAGITAHLIAMRGMIVVIAASLGVCFFLVLYLFSQPLVDFILRPVAQRGIMVIATKVSESLMMRIKTCLVASFVLCMPIIIWQIWRFVGPALYPDEKRMVRLLFMVLVLLFVTGVVFAYLTVFPMAIDMFYEASEGVANPMWSVEGYFNFVLSFVLPFGLTFEMPAVMYILARRGMVTGQALARNRKFFILGASVFAAILTPPDVVSQVLLLLPVLALYEVSVLIARRVHVKIEQPAEASAQGR